MSNSSLATYKNISPNRNSPRNHKIDTITIHCMAGNLSVEKCGELFANSASYKSSNYGVDSEGKIGLYVPESDRSWASSSRANDNRAITIEVANDGDAKTGWHVSDKAMNSLINLLVDICKRNNIKELKWKADKSLIGQVNKQNMTVHRWFANKDCPGDYLYNKHSYIASEVNKKLKGKTSKKKKSLDGKFESAKLRNVKLGGQYKTTSDLNLRKGSTTDYDILVTIPKGEIVNCYGYYNERDNVKWLYVQYSNFTGFVCSTYLKKVN